MIQHSPIKLWVSHSSIGDFRQCPRKYYLAQMYDPQRKVKEKMNIPNKYFSLGSAVHDTLDKISYLDPDHRFQTPLSQIYKEVWANYSGELGGFINQDEESEFKEKGKEMLNKLTKNPGILLNQSIPPISLTRAEVFEGAPPNLCLSREENIILCGKLDWLEYLPEDDTVHIVDFKTGKTEESDDSMQIPIYFLLASKCQDKKVKKASYWYLEHENEPTEVALPSMETAFHNVLYLAHQIKEARLNEELKCRYNGCRHCEPYERILKGEGKYIGFIKGKAVYIIH